MKEFKEDKIKLEKAIEHCVNVFCQKYDVSISDIELTVFLNYVNINVKVDL